MAARIGKAASVYSDVAATNQTSDVVSVTAYLTNAKTYAVLYGVALQCGVNNSTFTYDITAAGSPVWACGVRAWTANDVRWAMGLAFHTAGSTGNVEFKGRITAGSGVTATSKGATLAVIEIETGDDTGSTDVTASTTSSTFQDSVSVTFTVGASETWLVLAVAEGQSNTTAHQLNLRLWDGATAYGFHDEQFLSQASVTTPRSIMAIVTATGAQTFTLQYASRDNATTVEVRDQRIMAIKLPDSGFDADEDRSETSTTSSSYQTKVTSTYSTDGSDHIVLATMINEASTASVPLANQLTAGGSLLGAEGLTTPTSGSTDLTQCVAFLDDVSASGSRTWLLQYKSDATNSHRLDEAVLAAFAIDQTLAAPAVVGRLRRQAFLA